VFARHSNPILAIAALLLLAGCEASTAPATRSERPVQVQRVTLANESSARDFVGVVRARHEIDLGFRVAGKIVSRLVNVGDRVRAGDVVARLDPRDIQLQVESADAELSAATTNLAQATADLERYTTLRANGYASVAEFDRKKSAKAEADGRIERARRSLELGRNQLAYADLKADTDGIVTATFGEAGQVVPVGQPVIRLAQRGEKEAVVALPETWLADARRAEATVRLWSDRERSFNAVLRELSPQADAATRTYAARFTIEDADDTVALGMTATVTLAQRVETPVARVPLSAVLNRGTGPIVYLVDQGSSLVQRRVTVASFTEDAALITSGLSPGERIVTLGVQKLEAGLKVRTIELR
jgi:RND family efflux transporter MFP subunit